MTYIIELLLRILEMKKDVQGFITNNRPSQWGENLSGNPDTSDNPDTLKVFLKQTHKLFPQPMQDL